MMSIESNGLGAISPAKSNPPHEPGLEAQGAPRAEFLALAEACGARLTGKPDGSEPIEIVLSVDAWRAFDAALVLQADAKVSAS